MEKDFEYIELFEIYSELLTEKQRYLFSSHYLYDLSFGEIAEESGGSRQSVFDAIKKVKLKLTEYEKQLKIKSTKDQLAKLAETTVDKQTAKKIREIIEK